MPCFLPRCPHAGWAELLGTKMSSSFWWASYLFFENCCLGIIWRYCFDDIVLMILFWWYCFDDIVLMILFWWYCFDDTVLTNYCFDDIVLSILLTWYFFDDIVLTILFDKISWRVFLTMFKAVLNLSELWIEVLLTLFTLRLNHDHISPKYKPFFWG